MSKKAVPLVSSRYAAMYAPNTTGWDFFDAFAKSPQCQAAFRDSDISTKGKNVEKYLTLTAKERLRLYREEHSKAVLQPPQHIVELLKLQSPNGKFERLSQVLTVLFMPSEVSFRSDHLFVEWEKATAFAIAAMRQQTEYFDVLCESHDKAFGWMGSNEIIFEARELLHSLQFSSSEYNETTNGPNSYSAQSSDESLKNETSHLENSESSTIMSDSNNCSSTNNSLFNTAQLVAAFNNANLSTIDETTEDRSITSAREIDHNEMETRPVSPSFSALQEKLHELSAVRDEAKIATQQTVVNKLQLEVITECINIENFVQDIHVVAERCIKLYNEADTRSVRQKQFDELTAMLGEGKAPTKGFTDWKEHGVKGLRPLMMKFFLTVQRLAEERITLQELETPQGRHLLDKIVVEKNLDKWKLLWNGHDVVLKVVHCLDFLRKCRELSEWYGPSFYFVANPLMLPFPMHVPYENKTLDMVQKVSDQRMSVPHLRLGCMNIATKSEWQHQQYLNKWRRDFQLCAEQCGAFNWPTVPDIREDIAMEQLYTCMLVIYTTCESTLKKSYLWEKKFISNIQSVRGQDKNLVGQNTSKVNKKLDIPPVEIRKKRPPDLLNAAAHRESNVDGVYAAHQRKASTASSFAPYGYSLASSSKYSNGTDLDFSQDFDEDGNSEEGLAQRPHLQEVMKFNNILKTAEEKVKQKAAQLAALQRKNSVMAGAGRRRTSTAQHHMHRASRSPSIQIGNSGNNNNRRTSSRPSSAHIGGIAAGSPSRLTQGKLSPADNSPGNPLSPVRHSILRKASTTNGNINLPGSGGARDSTVRRESTLRKSSTVSTLSQGKLSPFTRDNASLRKSSSAGTNGVHNMGSFTQGRKDSSLQPLQSGKFKPSFRSPSQGNITLTVVNNTIAEEGSAGTLDTDEQINEKETTKDNIGKSNTRGSILAKNNPTLLNVTKRNTASRGSVLPSLVEGNPSPGKSRKLSTAPSVSKTTINNNTTTSTVKPASASKSIRLNMLAPSLAEASETSVETPEQPSTAHPSTNKKPKSRKKSTLGVAAEPSLDDTTVSLALASPTQSPGVTKSRKRSTIMKKRSGTPVTGEKTSPTGTPETGTTKKRGTILSASDKNSKATLVSSVVTRLPPVQANVRLTRRKEA